jgi:hypothetical protein
VIWLNRTLCLYIPMNNGTSSSMFIPHSGCLNPQWYIAKETSYNSILLNVSCEILFWLTALLQTFTVTNWGRADGSVKKLTEFQISAHTWLSKTTPQYIGGNHGKDVGAGGATLTTSSSERLKNYPQQNLCVRSLCSYSTEVISSILILNLFLGLKCTT